MSLCNENKSENMIVIDWSNFTPFASLLGGVLIGFSAVLLMLINGRIAGVSGLLSKILVYKNISKNLWVFIFFTGLLLGPIFYSFLTGPIKSNSVVDIPWLILAGLLVGFGTFIGNGCTSGHGICGLSRFSIRSLAAVTTFVFSGMLTVYIIRFMGS
tara:strand:- start:51 stop:521 length:471 start_codon:yes stop_codon:yes gene_type:complete